jgi:hypothetical protein
MPSGVVHRIKFDPPADRSEARHRVMPSRASAVIECQCRAVLPEFEVEQVEVAGGNRNASRAVIYPNPVFRAPGHFHLVCRDAVRPENSAACVLNTIFLYRQR